MIWPANLNSIEDTYEVVKVVGFRFESNPERLIPQNVHCRLEVIRYLKSGTFSAFVWQEFSPQWHRVMALVSAPGVEALRLASAEEVIETVLKTVNATGKFPGDS